MVCKDEIGSLRHGAFPTKGNDAEGGLWYAMVCGGLIAGKVGLVEVCCAAYENPSLLSLGLQGPKQPLYR